MLAIYVQDRREAPMLSVTTKPVPGGPAPTESR